MKKIAHLLMGRLTIVGVSILLQICWLFLVLWKFSYQFTYANSIIRAAAIVLVLVIANKWENPANKLSWTFLILLSPILGIMLYFLFGRSGLTKHTREQMDAVNREVDACMPVDEEAVGAAAGGGSIGFTTVKIYCGLGTFSGLPEYRHKVL